VGVGASASDSGGTGLAPTDYSRVVRSVQEHVRNVVPAGASVLVVSRGDEDLVDLGDRSAGHFPQDEEGQYLGYYPSDSESAINMLEGMRAAGAQYLVFPSPAFWWLNFYGGLRRHLQDNYHLISAHRDCLVFALVDVPASVFRASGADGHDATGHALREIAKHLLPAGALVVVASLGDEDWSTLAELQVWQLPLSAGGSAATMAHLETMQSNGAEFLIVPQSAFEWLDEHAGLLEHLRSSHLLVTHQQYVCDIYELCPPESQAKIEVAQPAAAAEHGPARKPFLEKLFGWTRRSSANGQPV